MVRLGNFEIKPHVIAISEVENNKDKVPHKTLMKKMLKVIA